MKRGKTFAGASVMKFYLPEKAKTFAVSRALGASLHEDSLQPPHSVHSNDVIKYGETSAPLITDC